jgi:membrane-associated phospholipid phosphatase
MIRYNALLPTLILSLVASQGCSSFPTYPAAGSEPREAAIRDRLWSESVLIRGASPDDTIGTVATVDTIVSNGPVGATVESPDDPRVEIASDESPACTDLNFYDDWDSLPSEFCDDLECAFNDRNLCVLLIAGGASYLVHETLDDEVAAGFRNHRNRWGDGQEFFAAIGNPGHHFAAIGGMYFYSLHTQDAELHDLSKSLFNAVAITGLATVSLKATIGRNTEAPNGEGDPFVGAWPSGHTSSAFTVAAVLDEYYGPKIGIPAYILAGLAGWERIDDGEHDLSDVVFGAVLGHVIGKSVAANHLARVCGMECQPLIDPVTGTTGVAFERRF